jgi:hypothetical protein
MNFKTVVYQSAPTLAELACYPAQQKAEPNWPALFSSIQCHALQQVLTDHSHSFFPPQRPQPPPIAEFAVDFCPPKKNTAPRIAAKFSQSKIRLQIKLRLAEIFWNPCDYERFLARLDIVKRIEPVTWLYKYIQ